MASHRGCSGSGPGCARLIVVHDAFASRGVAEEQIAFFGVAQARVGVLSAEVSAVARRLARARHASVDALTDVMVAVVVLAVVAADLCAEVRAVGRWLVAACRYRVVDAVVLALHLGPHGLDKIMRAIGSAAIGIMHHVIRFFTVRRLVRAVFKRMVARHQPCSCRCRHRSGADHRVHLHQSHDTCAGRSIHPCHGTTSQCRKYH